jgi:hypothetical protein
MADPRGTLQGYAMEFSHLEASITVCLSTSPENLRSFEGETVFGLLVAGRRT